MKKKLNTSVFIAILLTVFVIMFMPFCFWNTDGLQCCRYRLGVYVASWDESDSYDPRTEDDILFYSIELKRKIGGPLEYFGLRKIKYETEKKEEYSNK